MNAELWSDVVRSHIQILRSKVDKDFSVKLIKTAHSM
jgi:DNA-binding response OmpR family regulator